MFCDHVAITPVQTVESTHSQSNQSRIPVELDSHADTCVVGSKVLVVHGHEYFVDVYSFDKETRHTIACTVNTTIVYKDPITHFTVILMINPVIKIDSMYNILVCPIQCYVHGIIGNKCPKFLSALPAKDDHALLVHDPSLDGVTS